MLVLGRRALVKGGAQCVSQEPTTQESAGYWSWSDLAALDRLNSYDSGLEGGLLPRLVPTPMVMVVAQS